MADNDPVTQRDLENLKELFRLTRASDKEAIALALSAAEKAVTKAEAEALAWRQNANEWRGAMTDRERAFLPRTEHAQAVGAMNEKLGPVVERVAAIEGRFMAMASIGTAFGIAGVIYAVVK